MREPLIQKAFTFLRSIKFGIVFGNVAILLLTTLFVITYSQKNNYNVLIQNTQNFMDIAKKNVLINIQDELKKIETVLLMSATIAENLPGKQAAPLRAIKTLGKALDANSSIASIFFGFKDDFFASILRKSEEDTYQTNSSKKLPRSSKYAWKIIDNECEGTDRIEKWFYLDPNAKVLDSETLSNPNYFPTKRPWFKINERDIFWTEAYVFTGSIKEPGITASITLQDTTSEDPKGVLAIDVTLTAVGTLLKAAKTISSSELYLIDDNGRIISSSQDIPLAIIGDKNELPNINDPKFALVKKVVGLKFSGKDSFYFEEGDHNILAQVSEMKVGANIWTLVNITPDHEFLASIYKLQYLTFFKCLIIVLLASIVMFIFARRVSSTIIHLSGNARKIENFELDNIQPVKSKILELQQLSHSMDAMQHSMESFSKYVPKDLVMKLLNDNTSIDLGGEQREISLFFSDIEGFTTISEQVKPKELLDQLTDYFTALTDIMGKHNATIDKFIGDSIMAFWGAPDPMTNHAQHACHSALQIQRILHMKNSDWINLGLYPFPTRIGIHTSTVLVGNIGSKTRLNYTAIGDDVNLCARLEGLNKYYKTNTMISGDTYAKVNGDFFARPLGKVAVKGKKDAIAIYELMGAFKHIDTALLLTPQAARDYEKYLVAYGYIEQKRFKSALEIFEDIAIKDGPVNMMIASCKELIENPPKDEWNGLIKYMDTK